MNKQNGSASRRVSKASRFQKKIEKLENKDNFLKANQKRLENYERVTAYDDNNSYVTITGGTTVNEVYWPR